MKYCNFITSGHFCVKLIFSCDYALLDKNFQNMKIEKSYNISEIALLLWNFYA